MGVTKKLLFNFLFLLLTLLLLCTTSCNTTEPPDKTSLELTLEDVSCTQAWIQLTTNNLQLPATLDLLKDNNITKTINLQTADTLLYIDSLLPNQTYQYQASSIQNPATSNELSVTTMDTTSHDFTFETWTFGEHGNSVLFDVAIIDENNIWAVGEIYLNDSLGNPDNNAYNAIRWDGSEWTLKRITVTHNGNLITPPLYGIFAFSETEIWLSAGVPIKGDGINWTQYHLFDMGVLNQSDGYLTKIWGSSSSDLYYSGTLGTITHWNGSNWTKIESGTDVNLRDISGQGDDIFISGYSLDYSKSVLLRLENNSVELIWEKNSSGTPPYGSLVYASKVLNNNLYVASSNGVYQEKLKIKHPIKQLFFSSRAINRVAGTGTNNLFTVGDWSTVWHHNGLSSRLIYSELNTPSRFHSAAAKDYIFAAVGMSVENVVHHKATILIGRR